jgi:peptidoglycan-N-acetylglucosamine deacetylase
MRRNTAISCALAFVLGVGSAPALAGQCANPNALGTSRTLVIDSGAHPRLGAMQYGETLPLAPGEVVLTFDDGPLPPYTNRILDILKSECVKATYFLVGRMAQYAPGLVRRIHQEGHTVGTHSLNHPLTFDRMTLSKAEHEIDGGIAAVGAALGDPSALAPFFRIPGLLRASAVERSLASRMLVTWSSDLVADDWHKKITANEVTQRALQRIEARGRGIMLLHDIQPATVLALPGILKGLKARGYRIVHVVPSAAGRPQTPTEPQQWASYRGKRGAPSMQTAKPSRSVPGAESFGVAYAIGPKAIASTRIVTASAAGDIPGPRSPWPQDNDATVVATIAADAERAEKFDWPQTVRLARLLPAQEGTWPIGQPRATAARKPAPRPAPAAAPSTCRNRELVGSLAPQCDKKPAGHQLSLTSRGPAG